MSVIKKRNTMSFITLIVFLFTLISPLSIYASSDLIVSEIYQAELIQSGYLQSSASLSSVVESVNTSMRPGSTTSITIDEEISNAIKQRLTSLYISKYNITTDKAFDAFERVLNEHPEYFYVSNQIQVYYYADSNIASQFIITYKYTSSEITQMQETFNSEVNYIISTIDTSMSDLEIALAVHDYFTVHFTYDYSYTIYDAYTIIVDKTGVCQAYALAYKYILNQLGMECEVVTSDTINHAWDIVSIDGTYYYVDATWDDNYLTIGKSSHYNFMKSETGITNLGHVDMNQIFTAEDTTYDYYFWTNVTDGMTYMEGFWYFIDKDNYLKRYDFDTNELKTIYKPDVFLYYTNLYSNFVSYDGKLYYNNENTIYCVNPDGTDEYAVYTVPEQTTDKIFGIAIYKNELMYTLKSTPTDDDVIYSIPLSEFSGSNMESTETSFAADETVISDTTVVATDETTTKLSYEETTTEVMPETTTEIISSITYGDINGDDNVSIIDIIVLSKYLYGQTEISEQAAANADITQDGVINIFDMTLIKRILLRL